MVESLGGRLPPLGWWSQEEYVIPPEREDDIYDLVAGGREAFHFAVISFNDKKLHDISAKADPRLGIVFDREATRARGLGVLDHLAVELVLDIVLQMDICTLFKFRQVNLRARQLVDDSKAYRVALTWGGGALSALLRTGLGDAVSLADFYRVICTRDCACGMFGGYVTLLKWRRSCYDCLLTPYVAEIRPDRHVGKVLRIDERVLITPAFFEPYVATGPPAAGLAREEVLTPLEHDDGSGDLNCMGPCMLPWYDKRNKIADLGASCKACDQFSWNFPPGFRPAGLPCYALHCAFYAYSREQLLDHVRWCRLAQVVADGGSIKDEHAELRDMLMEYKAQWREACKSLPKGRVAYRLAVCRWLTYRLRLTHVQP